MFKRRPLAATMAASLAALVGGALGSVALTPEFGEVGGTDVILSGPHIGNLARAALGGAGALALACAVFAVFNSRVNYRRIAVEVTATSAAMGVVLGLAYRVLTAKTIGANIGGGIIVLGLPILAVVYCSYLTVRLAQIHQRARSG